MSEPQEIRLDTQSNPELAKDIEELQGLIEAAEDCFHRLKKKHGDLWDAHYMEQRLGQVSWHAQSPIEIIPEVEEDE